MMEYQKKVLIVFLYQCYWLIVFKICKNCYPQVFLKECKYIIKEKTMNKYINNDLEILSDDYKEEEDPNGEDD